MVKEAIIKFFWIFVFSAFLWLNFYLKQEKDDVRRLFHYILVIVITLIVIHIRVLLEHSIWSLPEIRPELDALQHENRNKIKLIIIHITIVMKKSSVIISVTSIYLLCRKMYTYVHSLNEGIRTLSKKKYLTNCSWMLRI